MTRRRRGSADDRQEWLPWVEPEAVLTAERPGMVLFEAPEVSRLVAEKPRKLPRVRSRRAAASEIESLGLPFGAREEDGRFHCWSCARELSESLVMRIGPGTALCPGCGARLPFVA